MTATGELHLIHAKKPMTAPQPALQPRCARFCDSGDIAAISARILPPVCRLSRKSTATLAFLLESFFTQRLMNQKQASPHTIRSYRDTFRWLLQFTRRRLAKPPSHLAFEEIDAPLVTAFLADLE